MYRYSSYQRDYWEKIERFVIKHNSKNLQKAGPVLELVHDVPRVGHRHAQQDRRVGVVRLRQGKVQQVGVRRVPVQDPVAQTGVI